MTNITNTDFANAVGVHFTMASRLRNGERKPGLSTVIATMKAYRLSCQDIQEWLECIDAGPEVSGAWLRVNIFDRSLKDVPAA